MDRQWGKYFGYFSGYRGVFAMGWSLAYFSAKAGYQLRKAVIENDPNIQEHSPFPTKKCPTPNQPKENPSKSK